MKLLPVVSLFIAPALLLRGWENSPSAESLEHLQPSRSFTSSPGSVSSVSIGKSAAFSVPSTNFFRAMTNRFLLVPGLNSTNLVPNSLRHLSPAPGIYKTEPFTCIVVVPGSNHDDRMVIDPANTDQKMSIVPPDLRFVPLPRK
jgi:hypothetical protein